VCLHRLRVAVQVKSVIEVHSPSQKRILRARSRKELLKLGHVVQLKVISDHRLDSKPLAQLQEAWLAAQARSQRVRVNGFDGRGGLAVLSSDVDKAPVDFSQKRKVQLADCRPLEDRLNDIASNDGFAHSKHGFSGQSRIVPQAKKVQLVERDGLCIEIEHSVRMNCQTRLLGFFP